MRLCVVHVASVWSDLLGSPPPKVAPEQVRRAATYAFERLPAVVASVGHGFDLTLLVTESPGGCYRRHSSLLPEHTERPSRSLPWGEEAWAPLRGALAACQGHVVVPPAWDSAEARVDMGEGECLLLAGLRPSGRDVIATLVRWWRAEDALQVERAIVGEPNLLRLRIVSGRATLTSLADEAAGVELVRSVRPDGSYAVAHPAELAAEIGDPRLVSDIKALELCGTWQREHTGARRSSLGAETARKLVETHHGSALVAVEMGSAADKLPGVSAAALAVLKAAGANGGRMVRRALAVCGVREDVAIDVGALLRPERSGGDGRPSFNPIGDRRSTASQTPTTQAVAKPAPFIPTPLDPAARLDADPCAGSGVQALRPLGENHDPEFRGGLLPHGRRYTVAPTTLAEPAASAGKGQDAPRGYLVANEPPIGSTSPSPSPVPLVAGEGAVDGTPAEAMFDMSDERNRAALAAQMREGSHDGETTRDDAEPRGFRSRESASVVAHVGAKPSGMDATPFAPEKGGQAREATDEVPVGAGVPAGPEPVPVLPDGAVHPQRDPVLTTTAEPAQPERREPMTTQSDDRPTSPRKEKIRAIFRGRARELAALFPKDGMVMVTRAVATACNVSDGLKANVTAESICEAAMACHHLGLEVGDQAYVYPFKDGAKLTVGPRGLIALAYRGGFVKSIVARCVFDGDEFTYNLGTNDILHTKALEGRRPQGKSPEQMISHAYVLIDTTTDGRILEVLTWEDLAFYRSFSKAATGPWFENFEGMARKTAIKRGLEFVPRSPLLVAAMRENEDGTYAVPEELLIAARSKAGLDVSAEMAGQSEGEEAARAEAPTGARVA